jgi:hypothetical protein
MEQWEQKWEQKSEQSDAQTIPRLRASLDCGPNSLLKNSRFVSGHRFSDALSF